MYGIWLYSWRSDMIDLKLYRFSHGSHDTIGVYFLDNKYQCFVLEDEHRTEKVYGETRVCCGAYTLSLRCEGGIYTRYINKHKHVHKSKSHGMICFHNSPNFKIDCGNMSFKYCLIHIGNDEDDTSGCHLVGTTTDGKKDGKRMIYNSTSAYYDLYPLIAERLLKGEEGRLHIIDL